jgi:hypothetical protein
MSDQRFIANATTLPGVPNGAYIAARSTRDGSLFVEDWKQSMILAGYGYHFDHGTLTTPIVGGGNGTILDIDEPEGFIAVPTGMSIIPLRLSIQCELVSPADHEVQEIWVYADKGVEAVTGAVYTAKVPYNMRLSSARAASCVCGGGVTTAFTTAPVADIQLARKQVVDDFTTSGHVSEIFELIYEPLHPPIIDGPCILCWSWGGTQAMSGYFQMDFIERVTSELI